MASAVDLWLYILLLSGVSTTRIASFCFIPPVVVEAFGFLSVTFTSSTPFCNNVFATFVARCVRTDIGVAVDFLGLTLFETVLPDSEE